MSDQMSEKQSLKICVTKADIAKGRFESRTCCPIARALRRLTGGYDLDVSQGGLWFTKSGKIWATKKYKRAANFMTRFDNEGRGAVKPRCFRLVFERVDWLYEASGEPAR